MLVGGPLSTAAGKSRKYNSFSQNISPHGQKRSGLGSVVGIATGYRLDGLGIESRCGGQDFPHRGVTLTPHPLLVPWSWNGRAIPLLPLWALRPAQSLSACTRGHCNFTFTKTKISSSIWQNQPTSRCSSRKHSLSVGTSIKIHTLTTGVSLCKHTLIRTEMKDPVAMSNSCKSYYPHLHAHTIFIPTYYKMFLLIIILSYL